MMLLAYKEAVSDSDTAIKLDPANARGYFRKATALKGLGNFDGAINAYQEGLNYDNTSAADSARSEMNVLIRARDKIQSIKDLLLAKRYAPALTHVTNLMTEIGANFRVVLLLKLECLVELKKCEEAINLSNQLMKSSAVGAGDVELLLLRAKCLYYNGDVENAIKHMQMCIRADPENSVIIKQYKFYKSVEEAKTTGNTAFRNSDWAGAISEWTKCINLDPRNVGVICKLYYNRGVAYGKLSRWDDSITDCTRAIQLDNGYIKAYIRRADSRVSVTGESAPSYIEQGIR